MTLKPSDPMQSLSRTGAAVLALLAALLVLPLALAPAAEGFIYWTAAGTIGRANLDGTGVNEGFITDFGRRDWPFDVAVDTEHLYWSSTGCFYPDYCIGAIGRADLDGSGVEGSFIPGIVPADNTAQIALDRDHIYWASRLSGCHLLCGYANARIGRANIDGSGVEAGFIAMGEGTVSGVAVDANHVYWAQQSETIYGPGGFFTQVPAIGRANIDGTGIEREFITSASEAFNPTALAVAAGHLYWINRRQVVSGTETIGRADLDGTEVDQDFIDAFDPHAGTRPGKEDWLATLAIASEHIYWAETEGGNVGGDAIGRADLDGARVDRDFISTERGLYGIAVDALTDTTPPTTKIIKGAPRKIEMTKLKLKFKSSEPNSTFECRLDKKKWKACESPKKVKHLDEGKHKFQVRAIDAARNVDPTPAKDKFKVVD